MSSAKTVKRGELLFKEGDKITSLIFIQAGNGTVCLQRPKKNIEVMPIGPNQILGETALMGGNTHTFSAVANSEIKFMEIPIDLAKTQVDAAPQFLKALIKSLNERLKLALNDVRSNKMEKDSSPCPEDQVAKIFGTIYHTASHKGAKDAADPKKMTVDWLTMKQYAQRIFVESPRRLEQAVSLLVKLKLAAFEMGKPPENPDGPDEIMKVHYFDLPAVEAFFEFFQYYYFKGGRGDILKIDDTAIALLNQFIKMGQSLEKDRFGAVSIDMPKAVEVFKEDMGINLSPGHFAQLEQKGIFAKRSAKQDGTIALSFELKEYETTAKIWKILKEIEKWNAAGFVDMTEEEKPKKKPGAPSCPNCSVEVLPTAKFCQECGAKLEMATKPAA
jgi:hypothetical protein